MDIVDRKLEELFKCEKLLENMRESHNLRSRELMKIDHQVRMATNRIFGKKSEKKLRECGYAELSENEFIVREENLDYITDRRIKAIDKLIEDYLIHDKSYLEE